MGPYHAIHVGAAAPIVPDALVEQLARPGRLIIPVDNPKAVDSTLHILTSGSSGRLTRTRMAKLFEKSYSMLWCVYFLI